MPGVPPSWQPSYKVKKFSIYKSTENNETHSNLFGIKVGVSCLVVSLAEFEVEVLILEELATGGFLAEVLDLDFCGLMSSSTINGSLSDAELCYGESIS